MWHKLRVLLLVAVITALALLPQVVAYADPIPCGPGC